MDIIADLHIHSRYSIATSSKLTPPYLERWARIKGLHLAGTGDCTHPRWLEELREQLREGEEGFYVLKDEVRRDFDRGAGLLEGLPNPPVSPWGYPRFVLTGEISTIYSREGRTRKVHHVVLLPNFEAAASFQTRLEKIGNIRSDGRPILGLDSRDLLELLLESDHRAVLIPAHIWTPWFSALGARSGFDSIGDCYRDLAPHIHAIETGLSSNPPMNWAVSALDRFAVISNSDAHSPDKLGREATILAMEPSFSALSAALAGSAAGGIRGTVEFFPQEGKYHYDGHRACGVCLDPEASAAAGGRCPVCGKALTPGVLRRVRELADRPVDEGAPCPAEYGETNRRPYEQLIPLRELLAELLAAGAYSKKVTLAYDRLIEKGGSEFALLRDLGPDELAALGCPGVSGPLLAEAIGRMRSGEVDITPGYDGEYGLIRACPRRGPPGTAFPGGELFETPAEGPPEEPPARRVSEKKRRPVVKEAAARLRGAPDRTERGAAYPVPQPLVLDRDQEGAINHPGGPALIIAGPGTGKTAVLALRIARLIEGGTDPRRILALSFTVKAAEELRERIAGAAGGENAALLTAGTFHSLGRSILKARAAEAGLPEDFIILDEEARSGILEELVRGPGKAMGRGKGRVSAGGLGRYIEGRKRFLLLPGDGALRLGPEAAGLLERAIREMKIPPPDLGLDPLYRAYRDKLKTIPALDFDDLLAGTVRLLAAKPAVLLQYREGFSHVFADEYQDINFAQYALLRLLAPGPAGMTGTENPADGGPLPPPGAGTGEICVIGDPNQAIYGFRGADKGFIDHFLADYPGAAVYRLAQSFRCAVPIIEAASRLTGTELRGKGDAVSLYRSAYPSDRAEAEGIARRISALIGGTGFFALDSGVADPAGGDLISLGRCPHQGRGPGAAHREGPAGSRHTLPPYRGQALVGSGTRPFGAAAFAGCPAGPRRGGAPASGLSPGGGGLGRRPAAGSGGGEFRRGIPQLPPRAGRQLPGSSGPAGCPCHGQPRGRHGKGRGRGQPYDHPRIQGPGIRSRIRGGP
ncbi:MAG: UvrD-helicase domain-containing protein [Treponema sp.]|nr:UvrD-helicase domain-containing protein [Treponema sp.]